MRPPRRASPAVAVLASALAGCALAPATPPTVEVQAVELRGAGLLDQALGVTLCVTNPNDAALDFRQVRLAIDVAGVPLGESVSETAVRVPPHASTLVPFAATVTERNLGPQLLSVLQTGGVEYRLRGSVQLAGALPIGVPFSRSGRLDLLVAAGSLLADGAVPDGGTRCSRPPLA